MNSYMIGIVFVLGMFGMGVHGQEFAKDAVQRFGVPSATLTTNSLLLPVLEVLHRAKTSGSMEFGGRCTSFVNPGYPEFPKPHGAAMSGDSPLQAVRELYDANPRIVVTQDPQGTIRIIENGVPQDILNIRISHVSFNNGLGGDLFSANAVVERILSTPEVSAFMNSHDIVWPFPDENISGLLGGRSPNSPHISGAMENVTVKEVLDRTLNTFPGLWIYENCPRTDSRQRTVYFKFYKLLYFSTGPVVG